MGLVLDSVVSKEEKGAVHRWLESANVPARTARGSAGTKGGGLCLPPAAKGIYWWAGSAVSGSRDSRPRRPGFADLFPFMTTRVACPLLSPLENCFRRPRFSLSRAACRRRPAVLVGQGWRSSPRLTLWEEDVDGQWG